MHNPATSEQESSKVKAVYSELHRCHDPQFYLVRGVVKRTTEQPERADRLLAGLKAGKHTLIEPTAFGQGPRARVHSPEYLNFLEEAWDLWSTLPDAGSEMIPNMHPVRNEATYPTHIVGRLGWHTTDTPAPPPTSLSRRRRWCWTARKRSMRCAGRPGITPIAISPPDSAS
jgi:acetoin utilization deacetylase AcuC-like enzyme